MIAIIARVHACAPISMRVRVCARGGLCGVAFAHMYALYCSAVDRATERGPDGSSATRNATPHPTSQATRRARLPEGKECLAHSGVLLAGFLVYNYKYIHSSRGLLQCTPFSMGWTWEGKEGGRTIWRTAGSGRAESRWVYVSTIVITSPGNFPGGFPA